MRSSVLALVVLTSTVLGATGARAEAREVTLRPGAVLVTTVGGFAPEVVVTERLTGTRTASGAALRADTRGEVRVRYHVPRVAGRYRLLLVGRAPVRTHPRPAPTGPGDRQAVVVEIPRLVGLGFRVVPGAGGRAGVGGAVHPPEAGPLPAATGGDLQTPVRFGLIVLLVGTTLLLAGRVPVRRRASAHGAVGRAPSLR